MQLFRKLKNLLPRAPEPDWGPVVLESNGFRSGAESVDWTDIVAISAFKRDLVTFDDVWFQFDTHRGSVLVCEEQPGFSELETAVIERFPTSTRWRGLVIQPAFAENRTVLYCAPNNSFKPKPLRGSA